MTSAAHIPLLFLALPVLATLLGGLLALRLERYRPVLVALGAGLLLGAAFLDLLPEALTLGGTVGVSAASVLGWTLLFFLGFTALESGLAWVGDGNGQSAKGGSRRRHLGRAAGGLMIFHSFRDGMAIGAAFAASHTAGIAVATGIAVHDLGDGMNTVIVTTAGEKARGSDYAFLAADALAPFLGGLLTVWWLLSSRSAAVLLALAAGFFLQMSTSDFLPQLRNGGRGHRWLVVAVMGGAGVIWGANRLLGVL